jgi:hypothetical protein
VAWSVIAVNSEETQPTIDGILTLAILWLIYCREHASGRLFEDLKLIIPAATARTIQARMPWLNSSRAYAGHSSLKRRGFAASIARDSLGDDRFEWKRTKLILRKRGLAVQANASSAQNA